MAARLSDVMGDGPHVVLLNNLGGASVLEMSILANELLTSPLAGQLSHIIGPGALMTSLDMRGFSISVYPLGDEDCALLAAPAGPRAWPGCVAVAPVAVVDLPDGLSPVPPIPSEHAQTAAVLTRCCRILIEAEADLNALDAKSGDGDTGSTLAGAARALVGALDRLPLADHTQLFRAIGQELSQTMGGSSGVLLAIFFTAAGDAASGGLPLVESLKAGLARMQMIGGAQAGDRTMIDALQPALDALDQGLAPAAQAARAGATRTASMVKAKAGRASYLNAEQLQGHVDPGAEAVARLFERLSV